MLPELCPVGSNPLKVGEMAYDAIIVPNLKTIRKSTLDRLEAFAKEGGNLIFVGSAPEYVELKKSDEAEKLCLKTKKVSFNKLEISSALAENTDIEIFNAKGKPTDDLVYQLRQDGDVRWLFIAHAGLPKCIAIEKPEDITVAFNGETLDMTSVGFFVDKSIKTVKLSKINKGENVIEIKMPFDELTFPEWIYILGDFGVRVQGASAVIVDMPKKLGFSSTAKQNLPFYTGNITYKTEIDVPECNNVL